MAIKRLKASSIYYALFLSVVMGIVVGSTVLLSSSSKTLLLKLETEENLADQVETGLQFGLANFQMLPLNQSQSFQFFENDIDSVWLTKKKWGAYYLITSQSIHGQIKKEKTILAGQPIKDSWFNLFVSDLGRPISVCGETKLQGKIAVPEGGFKRAYIEGKNFKGNEYYQGSKVNSSRNLPELNQELIEEKLPEATLQIWDKGVDSITNSFTEKPIHLISDSYINLQNKVIDGQVIIESKDSIFVSSTSQLNWVILKSPIIYFESGFDGTVQCLASKKIVIEENCLLRYPSVLGLIETNFPEETNSGIYIGNQSQVIGTIYAHSTQPNFRKPVEIILNQETEVDGMIYCTGRTQFQGVIKGCLYTDKLYLKTKASTYENYLLDAQLSKDLPNDFIVASLFGNIETLDLLTCVK